MGATPGPGECVGWAMGWPVAAGGLAPALQRGLDDGLADPTIAMASSAAQTHKPQLIVASARSAGQWRSISTHTDAQTL